MKKLRITVEGKTYDVTVEVLGEQSRPVTAPAVRGSAPLAPVPPPSPAPSSSSEPPATVRVGAVVSPMAGAIKEVLVKLGDAIEAGQAVVVLDAMKMENKISSPTAGRVTSVAVNAGDNVQEGQVLVVVG